MNTAKKSIYNIVSGVAGQLIMIAIGLLLPRLFLLSYGSEFNGFLSSVNQIFVYLTLLEAGVGTATIQALYGPVGRGEREKISGIMSATAVFYRRTSLFYLIGVAALALVYPLVVKSTIAPLMQVAIIVIVGGGGVISYYFQAKYRLLLQAEGKQYILSGVTTIVHAVTSGVKLILLLAGVSILWLQAAQLALVLAQTLFYALYIKKNYSWLDLKAKPDNAAIAGKNSVLVHKVAEMIFNHTDVLLLTLILQDLKIVSVYVLYSTFVDMIATLIGSVNTGFTYRLGQLYSLDKSRHHAVFDTYETYYMALSFALYSVTYMFLLPFMQLYTKGIGDTNYLLPLLPLLFTAYKLIVCGRAACGNLISYAGHFKETRHHSIAEAVINLSVSIAAIFLFERLWGLGIYGALVGTLAALIYRANAMVLYANKKLLSRSSLVTYGKWGVNAVLAVLLCFAYDSISPPVDSYWQFILYASLFTCAALLLFTGVSSLLNPKAFKAVVAYTRNNLLRRR